MLKAICPIRFSPGQGSYTEQRGTVGTFISNVQKAQNQHPPLHSHLSPSGDVVLRERKIRKPQAGASGTAKGNRWKCSSQEINPAIKCFTQTPSLTPLWAPCTTSHTARLATYKTEASDHKHKKELCFATMYFEHSNRPAPQGETGFVPVSFRKRFQAAKYPRYTHGRSGYYTAKGAQGTFRRGRSSRRALHSPVADPCPGWVTLLSSCGYTVSQISGGCWGTPSMFALNFLIALLSTASLKFSSWLPTKTRGVS